MIAGLRRHLRSNVVGYLALFVALGGTAWALGANTVGSRQIRQGAVRTADLADRAVTHPKLAPNAVDSHNVKRNSLTGADVDEGSLGAVPSAQNASLLDSLDSTAFARGPGGRAFVEPIDYASGVSNTNTQVFSRGGLELEARCQQDPSPPHHGLLTFTAHTATDNATIVNHWGQPFDASSLTSADEDFDTGDALSFGPQNVGQAAGTIVYTDTAGDQAVVAWQGGHDAQPLGGTKQCLFSGVATTVVAP